MLSPPDSPIACFIVRHGQTVLNHEKKFRGSANPPLDSAGLKQAHTLANLFENIDLSCIFCSDKQRATKTAEIIAQKKGYKVHPSENLRALNVGDFSGQPRTTDSEADLQTYLDDPNCTIPGGESLNDFKSRIRPCIAQALKIYEEHGVPPLLVAHSSVVHEVSAMSTGNHKEKLVEPGGAIAIYFQDGKMKAEPIFRPVKGQQGSKAGSIT
jgi:broad specificity phosphatase PhoE